MPVSEEDKRVLLALIWSLKASDLSTLEAVLRQPQERSAGTTKSSCNAKFWSKLVSLGLAEESPFPQLDLAVPTLATFNRFITYLPTPEGAAIVSELADRALHSGWPPENSIVSPEAVEILLQYSEEENAESQTKLAGLYQNGTGVPEDLSESLKWYRRAADLGNETAMNNIGVMYFTGEGVPRDLSEAMTWCRKAADLGNAAAMDNVGALYALGAGVVQDYAEAANWYRKAADQGRAAAQCNLAALYASGQGVAQDNLQAYVWYSLGIAACPDRRAQWEAVAAQLSPQQIVEGDRLVSAWRALQEG
ncbi:MAG: tetratricopeptide repeat protein [Bryobacteraceae bacterium]